MAMMSYESRMQIKEKYSTSFVANFFIFENRLYEYVSKEKAAGRIIITYRCAKERHDVKIYVRGGKVIDVRAFYQI